MTEAQIKTLTAEYEAKLRVMVAEVKSKPYSVWNIETAYLRAFDADIEKHFADVAAGFNEATDKKKLSAVSNVTPISRTSSQNFHWIKRQICSRSTALRVPNL